MFPYCAYYRHMESQTLNSASRIDFYSFAVQIKNASFKPSPITGGGSRGSALRSPLFLTCINDHLLPISFSIAVYADNVNKWNTEERVFQLGRNGGQWNSLPTQWTFIFRYRKHCPSWGRSSHGTRALTR